MGSDCEDGEGWASASLIGLCCWSAAPLIPYYPGPNYFADLITSTFFQGIIGDKQLGENLAVPTVPILRQVRQEQNAES